MRQKSLIHYFLVLALVVSTLGISPVSIAATDTEQSAPAVPVDLGIPVQTAQTLDAVYGTEDGANVMYTTVTGSASSGDFATFNVINLDNNTLIRSIKLQDASNAWNHTITLDGRVFIGASHKMFVYSPATKQITDLGIPIPGTSSIWSLTSDDQGNVYGGIYSDSVKGRIFKIDAQTLEITDWLNAPVDDKEDYIRSLAYHDDYIYAGTGSTNGRVWKINATTLEKTRLELPGTPDDPIYKGKYDKMAFVYDIEIYDQYLFAFYNGPAIMQVYDLERNEWTTKSFENIRGSQAVTGYKEGKLYTSKTDKKMWEIDLTTLTERPVMDFDGSIRTSKWLNLPNHPEFTNGAMVTITFDGKVVLYDPINQLKKVLPRILGGQGINIQALETGPDGKIYLSTYMGSEGAQYDPNTGKFTLFPLAQSEGIGHVGDTMYFGLYPKAEIAAWDTNTPLPVQKGPDIIFRIGEEQDRPFVVTEGDGKLLLGTIPGYSMNGGALTIYDPVASAESGQPQFEVFRHVVQDQSITGLLYKDGLIYGSTSISGGLGNAPEGTRAKLFVWDVAAKKKIHEWEPQLKGLDSLQMISGLTLGPDGFIWASANGIVFAFDPVTREVVKSRNIHPDITKFGKWRPVHQRFSSDGLLYSDAGERLVVIDPETMGHTLIRDKASLFTLDNQDNLYVANGPKLLRYPPAAKPGPPDVDPPLPNRKYLNIINPDFEEVNEDGTIPGWNITSFTEGYSSVGITNELKASGNTSLKLVDASTKFSTELKSDPVPVIPGRKYTANFNMYLNGSFVNPDTGQPFSSSRASVGIRYYDKDGKEFKVTSADNKHIDGPQKSWIPIEMETTAPVNAAYMRITVFCSPLWVATVFYDDISVYTVIDPSEVPVIHSAELQAKDVKAGSDVLLSVKATENAAILVKEGDHIVAEAIGAGDTSVMITIPSPAVGTHNYTVTAEVDKIVESDPVQLPAVNVHDLTQLQVPVNVELKIGDTYSVVTQAAYGPLLEDVSSEAFLSTDANDIVSIEENQIMALHEGQAIITSSYKGLEAQITVDVMTDVVEPPLGKQEVTNKELKLVQGKASIVLLPGNQELILPVNAANKLAGGKLEVWTEEQVSLSLEASTLKDMSPKNEKGVSRLSVTLGKLSTAERRSLLNLVNNAANAKFTIAGDIIRFNLATISKEGDYIPYSQLNAAAKLTLNMKKDTDFNSVGVYRINADGTYELISSSLIDGSLEAEVNQTGVYAVLKME
jgi:hypothetical protein